jgi:hypothetical protein
MAFCSTRALDRRVTDAARKSDLTHKPKTVKTTSCVRPVRLAGLRATGERIPLWGFLLLSSKAYSSATPIAFRRS